MDEARSRWESPIALCVLYTTYLVFALYSTVLTANGIGIDYYCCVPEGTRISIQFLSVAFLLGNVALFVTNSVLVIKTVRGERMRGAAVSAMLVTMLFLVLAVFGLNSVILAQGL
jgi:hypothetical protein